MARLLVNIAVDDLERGIRFYTEALPLRLGRRLGPDFAELLGAEAPLYLIVARSGSPPFRGAAHGRDFGRHWTPVHLDFAVDDLEAAVRRAEAAGASREGDPSEHAWGRMALMADPFGNGFCLLELDALGYDSIAER